MNYDTIIFIGNASIIRRFNRRIRARFNVFYPHKETRLENGLIVVVYHVMKARGFVFNSAQKLNAIARTAIDIECSHNRHAGEYVNYAIIEG